MKILIFADSHGRTAEMYQAIDAHLPDAIIHLGDYYSDAHELACSYPDLPLYAVRGNNDWDDIPDTQVITLEGVRIYLCHGHLARCHGNHVENLPAIALRNDCTLALYGHTHRRNQVQHGNITIVNPGSISLPRDGVHSYVALTVAQGAVQDITFHDANLL